MIKFWFTKQNQQKKSDIPWTEVASKAANAETTAKGGGILSRRRSFRNLPSPQKKLFKKIYKNEKKKFSVKLI